LIKDREALLAFYEFPAEHWKHLRTTNVIESAFATVRHRTVRAKGSLSNKTALAMIFKLAEAAEKSWRRLDGHNQLSKIILDHQNSAIALCDAEAIDTSHLSFRPIQKIATIHASSGFIRGIPTQSAAVRWQPTT